ncbi:MAG: Gfo/Idh/MocA family oxidoreductase [Gemmataceae bacterium]|nr:Gfo/Idh/MocA family oxidoreductase [Gemmataceae bacterium]
MTSTRRTFIGVGAAAVLADPVFGFQANERIHCAVIGTRGRGGTFYGPLSSRKDTLVAALCDVDANALAGAAQSVEKRQGRAPRAVEDFRRVLDDKTIDAVFVCTPHHWHGPIALRALEAGKHVYVEKPASHVYREGQLLVQAAQKHRKIVQHGTQMRSSEVTARARELLRSGIIGDVKMAKAWNVQRHSHRNPVADAEPPRGVNYDLWLGPAPERRFNPNRFHGNWQWYRDYGNGDIGNDGIHDIDMACMGLGVDRLPIRVTAHGSKLDLTGEREYPDNMMCVYQFDNNKALIYEDRGWTHYGMNGFDSGNEFYGTKGYMLFSRRGMFQVYFDRKGTKGPGMNGDSGIERHIDNFLDCIRTGRQPNADARTAHLSCALVHLGEIAYRAEKVLHFDPKTETITNDKQANAMLTKEYRKPWGLPG